MGWIIFGILLGLLGLFIYKCINIIGPSEMGIKVFLGKSANEGIDSGVYWIWWPFESIVKYTKEIMEFKFVVKSIMTKKGIVGGYQEPIETAEINIVCTVYAYFDIKKLSLTIQKAPGKTAKDLGPKLVPYIKDVVRMLGGRLPWRLINQERRYFAENVLARIVPKPEGCPRIIEDGDADDKIRTYKFDPDHRNNDTKLTEEQLMDESPFVQFGLKDVAFVIEDINFTDKELQAAISTPEKTRLNAIATKLAADAEKYKREQEGKGSAKAREDMIKVIKDHKDLEFLFALKEMAQGTSNTILYQIPAVFESRIKDMLGGNDIGGLLRMLSPEDRKDLNKMINDAIANLNRGRREESKNE